MFDCLFFNLSLFNRHLIKITVHIFSQNYSNALKESQISFFFFSLTLMESVTYIKITAFLTKKKHKMSSLNRPAVLCCLDIQFQLHKKHKNTPCKQKDNLQHECRCLFPRCFEVSIPWRGRRYTRYTDMSACFNILRKFDSFSSKLNLGAVKNVSSSNESNVITTENS